MNLVDTAGQLPAEDAAAIVNMIRAERGLRTRAGYREHVTGINAGGEVRSLLSFAGSQSGEDRLFAAAADGIYDATASSAAPTRVYTFPSVSGSSGVAIGRGFTTQAGGHYLLVCDEANGYLHYNETGDTWTLPAQGVGAGEINGVDPRTLVFCTVHKHRVWFVKKDSADAWYLPVDAIAGTAVRFPFGPQFRHGGTLVGLWSWTIDGGAGIDDFLVGISSAGDLVVYQGTDPADAAKWEIRGVWYLGGVPAGRRIATDNGGDLLILSSLGILPLSRLPLGASVIDQDAYASRKIAPVLGRLITERTGLGWSVTIHPEDKALMVNTPAVSGSPREQWMMTLGARGWTQYQGLPINCAEPWRGKLYFGTTDGRVCIHDGDVDNVQLTGTANSTEVQSWLVSGSSDLGSPERKTFVQARPHFKTAGTAPSYAVEGRVDYDTNEPASVAYVPPSGSVWVWDQATWDVSVWGEGEGVAGDWRGIYGAGTSLALALRLATKARATLVSIDVAWRPGGLS